MNNQILIYMLAFVLLDDILIKAGFLEESMEENSYLIKNMHAKEYCGASSILHGLLKTERKYYFLTKVEWK